MTLTRMPRGQASGLARLIDRDAPAPTLSPAVTQALARRSEDGVVARVTRRVGSWCPHGRSYALADERSAR